MAKTKTTRFLTKQVPCPVCDTQVKRERTKYKQAVHAVTINCLTCGYHYSSMDLESTEGFLKAVKITFVYSPAYPPGLTRLHRLLVNHQALRGRVLAEARSVWKDPEGRTMMELVQEHTVGNGVKNPMMITRFYDWLVLNAGRFPILAKYVKASASKEKPRGKDREGDRRSQGQEPPHRDGQQQDCPRSDRGQMDQGGTV